ncbi:MAG: hypothetical protein GY777_15140 [Candidatus Brocadiaceae bacterium]|nr:hypothetical protein [Candidatus Brocadiaceae bacterium]
MMNVKDRLSKDIICIAIEAHRQINANSILMIETTKAFLCALGVFAVNSYFITKSSYNMLLRY